MTTTAEAVRRHAGPALFSFGFRPFFLFAALWGALVVPVWVGALLLGDGTIGGLDGRTWHVHEMLFGFVGGVIAGFLLTAVPNWTGRLPVTGSRLTGLFALWAAGRIVGLLPVQPLVATIVDSSFFVVFAALIWREVIAGRNLRNLPVCVMVTLLAAADIGFHLGGDATLFGQRAALAVAAGLIALIGGRIIPSFTQNWFGQRRISPGPATFGRFDKLALGLLAVALAAWVAAPQAAVAGLLLVAAGVVHLLRVLRWRGWKTGAEALVWILHLGYAWLAAALVLLGATALRPDVAPPTAGVHALTAGAIGVMILAVMTRASRGHTGRPRIADRATIAIYVAANLAAVVRVAAAFDPLHMATLLAVSATLWTLAFGGFALAYGPMLVKPRLPG